MTTSRPSSLIIPSDVFDERNTNINSKNASLIQQGRSSSSSADSSYTKNLTKNENNSSLHSFVRTATSSTTTDSDFESEQDDQNQSQTQKSETNSQEQLSRRVKHFHKLFKSEIAGDIPDLIDSYVCAYQGDILLQGKMYITDRYLCFHSRIISYVTKHVYRWEQIEDVTKERVAFIFPTAIGIQLKHSDKKIIYASFLQRDQAFEKIHAVWSQAVNDMSSCDDEGSNMMHDGTLKATNHNEKTNSYKRNSYDIIDGPEENGILDMCIKNNNKRPTSLISTKNNSDKQQPKILTNSYNKKSSEKHTLVNEKLSNDSNEKNSNMHQTSRHSRCTKYEKKQNNVEKRNSSLVNHQRPKTNSVKYRQSQSQDRTTLSTDHQTVSHSNSSSTAVSNRNVPIIDSKLNGISTKDFSLINLSINFITQTVPSLIHHFRTLPLKMTTCILLFFLLLFLHAFYLMKVANRIEHRLQSLHHLWPSSSATKHSFVSNPKEL
ncbi:hypothetical protein I4U23_003083 [Adineta vaga]|nr:hypothetical protein I4U23_003083 [Adineta vaga]